MAASHYQDRIFGLGMTGSLDEAVWRIDVMHTELASADRSDAFNVVANLDRSWIWWGRNWYGLIEDSLSHQGLSDNVYPLGMTP